MARSFNFADLIEIVCDAVPERTALICGAQERSYRELDERASRLAGGLSALGVGAGDHVGLYLYNGVEYIEAMLACFKLRAVPVNVNYRYRGDELRYLFNNADLLAVIHEQEFSALLDEISDDCDTLKHCISLGNPELHNYLAYASLIEEGDASLAHRKRSDEDIFMLYTGGTTGMPKGVMWPHRALFMAALGGLGFGHPDGPIKTPEEAGPRAIDGLALSVLTLAPLMHGAAWWSACLALMRGFTLILNEQRSLDGEHVWDLVTRHCANVVSIVGDAMAIPLTEALDAHPGRWDLSGVLQIGSGGAVFSDTQQLAFKKHLPNVAILNSFGSSESGNMGFAGEKSADKPDGLGNLQRSEFMDVLVQAEEGGWRHTAPGSGEQGIMARSGNIPLGYYKAPEKTRETFVSVEGKRWLLTGDTALLESDGTITVLGRGSNCINTGGEKVFPEEVEIALKQHPSIRDALVVGTPDERLSARITAVVSCQGDETPDLVAIQDHCRAHLAGYKVPRALVYVPEVPRMPSGKPDYPSALKLATA